MLGIPAEQTRSIAREWLAEIINAYPRSSRQFLLEEQDPFRNPAGQGIKRSVNRLVEELFRDMSPGPSHEALETIVRLRAVQNFSPREAVGFVLTLKGILHREFAHDWTLLEELDSRLDEMLLTAFDLDAMCRKQICEIKVSETKRRVAALERIYSEAEGG